MVDFVVTDTASGKKYRISGDGTKEQALAEFEAKMSANNRIPLPPQGKSVFGLSSEAQSYRPSWADKNEDPGLVEQALGGAKHAWDRGAQGIAGIFNQEAVSPEQLAAGKAFVDETGPASTGGQVATDVGVGAYGGGKILKAANWLRKALQAKNVAGAGAAAVGADIAGNAGLNAALSPDNRGEAAAWGGAGAAGGRVLARTLGGPVKPFMTPEAKTLSEAGVTLTPGQMMSGAEPSFVGRTLRNFEDAMQSYPIIGDVIRHGKANSIKSWNVNEINQALAPIGATVKRAGREGIDQADELVSNAYDSILPAISVPKANGKRAIRDIVKEAQQNNPLFDVGHEAKLDQFVDRRIRPLLGGDIDGATAKKLDSELGELARKYKAGGIGNEPLGDAFELLRTKWRQAIEGTTPEARQGLKDADAAYAKLMAMSKASMDTNSGLVTPGKLRSVVNKLNQNPTDTSLAARTVLPDTIPDSGTAGRLILHQMLNPVAVAGAGAAGAATGGGLALPSALAGVAAGMYTKGGARYMSSGGEDILNAVLETLRKGPMTPDKLAQMEEITRVLGSSGTKAYGNTGE